jgi:hypothetical protein
MARKQAGNGSTEKLMSGDLFKVGNEQTDALLSIQRQLLEAYEQVSRAWLVRVTSEADLWPERAVRSPGSARGYLPKQSTEKPAREKTMERVLQKEESPADQRQLPEDWAKLIRKLRWIGLEDEAQQLQLALRTLPPEKRDSVVAGPSPTD